MVWILGIVGLLVVGTAAVAAVQMLLALPVVVSLLWLGLIVALIAIGVNRKDKDSQNLWIGVALVPISVLLVSGWIHAVVTEEDLDTKRTAACEQYAVMKGIMEELKSSGNAKVSYQFELDAQHDRCEDS